MRQQLFVYRELWEWIDQRCQKRARTVLVAHNLAYDLRISDAFGWLPANFPAPFPGDSG